MFDVKAVQQEAEKEIAQERAEAAKKKIKEKLRHIATAKQVVTNLEAEYAVLLKEIGTDVG